MEDKELQLENGNYTRVVNRILEELSKAPLLGAELAVCIFIIRKTYGFNKKQDEISLTQFEQGVKRSRPTIVKALKNLQLVNILELVKKGTSKKQSNIWVFNKYYKTWKLDKAPKLVKSRDTTSKVNSKKLVKTPKHTKDNTKDNTKDIAEAELPPFEWKKYLGRMEEHKQRHVQVIAFYFKEKNIQFDSLRKAQVGIKRHLRAAKDLANFSDAEIARALQKAQGDYPEFTLETIIKILTR